jgi:serine/threonine protein kinase
MGALSPGSKIANRYRLERLLGEGGMGEVWVASHLLTGKRVALKVLKRERAARPEFVQRFFLEARAATAVQHPNVIEIHDVFQHDDAPVMVMDLLEGESLADKLTRDKKIALPELASVLLPVFSAVGTAHVRGVIHRDLKPENIFLTTGPLGLLEPKVLDFGIAKWSGFDADAVEALSLTRTGVLMGTLHYMSPEQASGEKGVDHRADVWALGIVLYECLTGARPFLGDNFGQVFKAIVSRGVPPIARRCPGLPKDVEDLVSRMLEKDPERRCIDLREGFEVLERYSQVSARPFGLPRSMSSSAPAMPPRGAREGESTWPDDSVPRPSVPRIGATTALESVAGNTTPPDPRRTRTVVASSVGISAVVLVGAALMLVRSTPGAPASMSTTADHDERAAPSASTAHGNIPAAVSALPVAPRPGPASPAACATAAVAPPPSPSSAHVASRNVAPAHASKRPSGEPRAARPAPAPPPAPTTNGLGLPEKPF